MRKNEYKSRMVTLGWVCGIISIILAFNVPLLSLLLGVAAVAIGIGLYKVARKPANTAITTGVIGVFLVLITLITTTMYDSIQGRAKIIEQDSQNNAREQ